MKRSVKTSGTILVVDDSEELVEWLETDLTDRNYIVDSVLEGESCLEKCLINNYQFVILDVMMPGETLFTEFFSRNSVLMQSLVPGLASSVYVYSGSERFFLDTIMNKESGIHIRDGEYYSDSGTTIQQIHDTVVEADFTQKYGDAYIHFDGFTVCRIIKGLSLFQNWPHIFMFTAGGGTRHIAEMKAIEFGADAYFLKSEYEPLLLNKLKQIMEQDALIKN